MAETNFQSSLDSEGSSSLTSDEPSVSSLPAKKNKTYDAAYKLKVIEYAAKHTNREAGRKFNVGESSVRDWRKQKNKLAVLPSKSLRLPGGGRRAHAPDIEETDSLDRGPKISSSEGYSNHHSEEGPQPVWW